MERPPAESPRDSTLASSEDGTIAPPTISGVRAGRYASAVDEGVASGAPDRRAAPTPAKASGEKLLIIPDAGRWRAAVPVAAAAGVEESTDARLELKGNAEAGEEAGAGAEAEAEAEGAIEENGNEEGEPVAAWSSDCRSIESQPTARSWGCDDEPTEPEPIMSNADLGAGIREAPGRSGLGRGRTTADSG